MSVVPIRPQQPNTVEEFLGTHPEYTEREQLIAENAFKAGDRCGFRRGHKAGYALGYANGESVGIVSSEGA